MNAKPTGTKIANLVNPAPEVKSEGVAALEAFMGQHGASVANMTGDAPPTAQDMQPMASPPMEDELAKAAEMLKKTPEKTYRERLAEIKVSYEEAMVVIDDVFARGFYEKTYKLSQHSSVTFRTRTVDNHEKMLNQVEEDRPSFTMTAGHIMSINNLADSLLRLTTPAGVTEFSSHARERKLTYVKALSGPVFTALVTKLALFDRFTMTVLDTGAEENF